jgi:glycosyltransferase involved in cell wall biosynthesis
VCLVTQQLRSVRSGVGTYARQLTGELLARGVSCTVALRADERPPPDAFPAASFLELPPRGRFDPTPGGFWSLSRGFAAVPARTLEGFDLIHFLDAREGFHYLGLARRRGIPVVGTVHDDYAARARRSPLAFFGSSGDPISRWAYYTWLSRIEARTIPELDALIANSDAVLGGHRAAYELVPGWGRVVRYGLAPPPAAPPVALEGDPAVVFIGGNFYRKGLHVLVQACATLAESLPGVRLHVIGADRNAGAIRALARRTGSEDRIRFHGHLPREQALATLAGATCLAVPSLTEGFGLVHLEAMQLSIPTIGGDTGGTRELIRDGENGLLVEPGSASLLATAIRRVARDAELRARLVRGGLATVPLYAPACMAEATLRVYDDVLGRSAGARQAPPVASVSSAASLLPAAATEKVRS